MSTAAVPAPLSRRRMSSAMITLWPADRTFEMPDWERTIAYYVWKYEICPTTQRLHIQMYCQFKKQLTLNMIRAFFDNAQMDIRPQYARDSTKCVEYCKKLDTTDTIDPVIREGGCFVADPQIAGVDRELSTVIDKIKTGTHPLDLVDTYPHIYARFRSMLYDVHQRAEANNDACRDVRVKLLVGASGTGKTHTARAEAGRGHYMLSFHGDREPLWNGYVDQDAVIIDELPGSATIEYLLRILDKYPCRLRSLYGFAYAHYTRVYLTSNIPIEQWYPHASPVHVAALRRRIHEVVVFNTHHPYPGLVTEMNGRAVPLALLPRIAPPTPPPTIDGDSA